MDSGLTIGPTAAFAGTHPVRPDPVPVREAVPTELASSQSVTAAAEAAAARNDSPRHTPSEQITSNTVIIDSLTHEVIYREIDERTGQVVGQIPAGARLGSQAYAQTIANGQTSADAHPITEA